MKYQINPARVVGASVIALGDRLDFAERGILLSLVQVSK